MSTLRVLQLAPSIDRDIFELRLSKVDIRADDTRRSQKLFSLLFQCPRHLQYMRLLCRDTHLRGAGRAFSLGAYLISYPHLPEQLFPRHLLFPQSPSSTFPDYLLCFFLHCALLICIVPKLVRLLRDLDSMSFFPSAQSDAPLLLAPNPMTNRAFGPLPAQLPQFTNTAGKISICPRLLLL